VSKQSQGHDSLSSRIERLEQQNRRFRRGALACVLLLVGIGLMAQTKQRTPAPQARRPAPPRVRTVEAESFILKDTSGRVRAELSMSGTGPSLKLKDEAGTALVTLSLNDGTPKGPMLLLSGPQRHAAFALSVLEGGGSQLSLTGARPDIQLHLGVTPEGTAVELTDKDGFTTTLGNGVQVTRNGQVKNTSAAAIALYGKERRMLWSAP
jgi:hypothetical protein